MSSFVYVATMTQKDSQAENKQQQKGNDMPCLLVEGKDNDICSLAIKRTNVQRQYKTHVPFKREGNKVFENGEKRNKRQRKSIEIVKDGKERKSREGEIQLD